MRGPKSDVLRPCTGCGMEMAPDAPEGLCPGCLLATPWAMPALPRAPLARVQYVGDYELVSEIARGGMGVVFRARQVSLNRSIHPPLAAPRRRRAVPPRPRAGRRCVRRPHRAGCQRE